MMGVIRNTKSRQIVGLVAVLLTVAVQSADAVAILQNDGRLLSAVVESCDSGCVSDSAIESPGAPFAPFVFAVGAIASIGDVSGTAVATQASSITTSLFTGEGTATASMVVFPPPDNETSFAFGSSDFIVQFQLLTPHSYLFEGSLAHSGGSGGEAFALANLSSGVVIFGVNSPALAFVASGVLVPDIYSFGVRAFASAEGLSPGTFEGTAGFDFRFALTDLAANHVPEPGTLILLSLGVGAVGFRCWRKSRNRAVS